MARNNLGATYDGLGLPISAVACYERAAADGNAWSKGNLAYLYLNAGFEQQARRVIEEARNQGDEHARLASAASELASRRDRENERAVNIKTEGERRARFLRAFADAYFVKCEPACPPPEGWVTQTGEPVELSVKASSLAANWVGGKSTHSLKGTLKNKGLRVTHKVAAPLDDFFAKGGDFTGFAYFSPDGNRLFVMATEDKKTEYFELERKEPAAD